MGYFPSQPSPALAEMPQQGIALLLPSLSHIITRWYLPSNELNENDSLTHMWLPLHADIPFTATTRCYFVFCPPPLPQKPRLATYEKHAYLKVLRGQIHKIALRGLEEGGAKFIEMLAQVVLTFQFCIKSFLPHE